MMDSSGRIHVIEDDLAPDLVRDELHELQPRRTGFSTRYPMPEQCDARRVLKAVEKLGDAPGPVSATDAALLPLTPFERGYVLGLLEAYEAWRASR